VKPADVLDHATSEIVSGSKLGIDATKKLPGAGFNLETAVKVNRRKQRKQRRRKLGWIEFPCGTHL
jgi:3-polyprenyl-4-hydroxybenzoate decarboxylase